MRLKKCFMVLALSCVLCSVVAPTYTAHAETKTYTKDFNKDGTVFTEGQTYKMTFTMKKSGKYSGYLYSPDGTKYALIPNGKKKLIALIKNYSDGEWQIVIHKNKGTIGEFTMKAEPVTLDDGNNGNFDGSVTVVREITGFNAHFEDGTLVCSWQPNNGAVYITVTDNSTGEQLDSQQISDATTYSYEIPQTVKTITVSASDGSSAGVNGSGRTYTFDVVREFPGCTVSYPVNEYCNSEELQGDITLDDTYTVEVKVNDITVLPATNVASGASTLIVPLTGISDGDVILNTIVSDAKGNKVTYPVGFKKDTVAPKLTLAKEYDGTSVNGDTLTIEGSVKDFTHLFMNETEITPATDGTFSADCSLHDGNNKIVIKAVDAAGNESVSEINVTASKAAMGTSGGSGRMVLFLIIIIVIVLLFNKKKKPSGKASAKKKKTKTGAQPEEVIEYYDENGNRIDPSELGDDVVFVDENGNEVKGQ